jgi:hypothetical protein
MNHTNMPIMRATLLANIPMAVLAPHEKQALQNHGQTLEKLASRGGLSASEALAVLEDRPWRQPVSQQETEIAVINKVREWRAAQRTA